MLKEKSKNKFFYGWIILIGCMLIQAIPYSIAVNLQSQFMNYVIKGEGFTLGQFSLVFTIGTIVSALVAPFIGSILSKSKSKFKYIYLLGAILSGGGFLLFAFAENIFSFYGIAVIVQIGTAIISTIGVPLIINSWFSDKKGFAMGLAFAGAGIGNIFLQITSANLLATEGYRSAYMTFGILSLIIAIPVAIFIIRLPKPTDEVDIRSNTNTKEKKEKISNWGYTFNEVKKIRWFWVLAVGFIFVGLYVSSMAVQYINYFYTLGFTPSFVGTVGAIFAFFTIVGNFSGGILFDKVGIRKALALACFLSVSSGIILIFIPNHEALGYIFVVLCGISVFAYIVGPSYLTGALFGNKEYGTILGIIQIFFAVGFAFGSSIFGLIVDLAGGSYTLGWIMSVIYAFIAYSLLIFAVTKILKHNKKANVHELKKIS